MDRLSAMDLMSIWPEERGWPNDIGALVLLDGSAVSDESGRLRIEALRDHIGNRLHLVPRFGQLIYRPRRGLGRALWVDAANVDLAQHVDVAHLDAPNDEQALLRVCEKLRSTRLPFRRPLWRMTFITGLADGRVGLFMQVHHAIADGVSGIAALGAFVDVDPSARPVTAPPRTPRPFPSARALLRDNVRRGLATVDSAFDNLAHPGEMLKRARAGWPALSEAFFEERAASSSLNARTIGSARRFGLVRGDLDVIKEIAHAQDAKVNDVLMTALAGGFRDILLARDEAVAGTVFRTAVPVSLHGRAPGKPEGNRDGMMVVPLPIGEPSDLRRLRLIARETAGRRTKVRPPGGTLFRNGVLQRAFLKMMEKQRFMNAYAANVPGPPVQLYLAGAPVLEMFPMVPISANMSIGIGALSYMSQFNITAVADRDLVPDLDVFVAGMDRSLRVLQDALLRTT